MRTFFALLFLSTGLLTQAQFAPRNGWVGSTAVPKDSSIIISWASGVQDHRGWLDIRYPDSGRVSAGLTDMALGKADGQAVSLGDAGWAVVSFSPVIVNGPGADFAIFENGFHIKPNSDSDFLEFAFVEVSSDGQNWVRFPAQTANDTSIQLRTFDGSRATKVHNLAGKYTGGFGTPFDLEELKDSAGIDLTYIAYVRVIDVVGSLVDSLVSRDALGVKINDPFPTSFAQGGFDLDAVGVMHNQQFPNGISEIHGSAPFPNPANAGSGILLADENTALNWCIYSLDGKEMATGTTAVAGKEIGAGIYVVRYCMEGNWKSFKWVVQ